MRTPTIPLRRLGAGLIALGAVAAATLTALTVPAGAATATELRGATLSWKLNPETQGTAFFGGCQYFSAGQSDGTQAAYRASDGDVRILQGSTPVTYANRCAFTNGGEQHVEFGNGTGTRDTSTGTTTLAWTGSWSVNFYGGLAPFWITDPVLTVDGSGRGQLVASVGGYGSSQSDPTSKHPIPTVDNVVIADLSGISVGDTGFTVTPQFTGVTYDAPAGATPQTRTTAGWGSWPKSFADVQQSTGLGSYWYSSGGSSDAKKPPLPLTIAYTAAAPTGTPTTTAPTTTPPTTTTPTTSSPTTSRSSSPSSGALPGSGSRAPSGTCSNTGAIRDGYLTWGFKKSFRSYVASGPSSNSIAASNGASILESDRAVAGNAASGTYRWPIRSGSAKSAISFTAVGGGRVTLAYPSHFFRLTIANPKVVVSGSSGSLYADVTLVQTGPSQPTTNARKAVRLASLDLRTATTSNTTRSVSRRGIAASLQDTSAFSLNGTSFYQRGQRLDDAALTWSACTGGAAGSGAEPTSQTAGGAANGAGGGAGDGQGLVPGVRYRPTSGLASTGAPVRSLLLTGLVVAGLGGLVLTLARRRRSGAHA